MKKLAIVAVSMMVGLALQAQGFVNFANAGFTPSARYFDVGGANLAGSYVVELWVGADAGTMSAVPGSQKTVNFTSGFFNAGSLAIPLNQLDGSGKGVASVRVWQNPGGITSWAQASSTVGLKVGQSGGAAGGSWAISPNLQAPGQPPPAPASLAGMPSITMYNVVPEPSVIALGLLGAAALLLRRRK